MSHRRPSHPRTRSYTNDSQRLREQKSYLADPRYKQYLTPVTETEPVVEATSCAAKIWFPEPLPEYCHAYRQNAAVTERGICARKCGWEQYIRRERE